MLTNSKLGFGMMRLPKNENGEIILDEVQALVDQYIQNGFTYFDTAYAYAGSEEAMKKTLVEKYDRNSYTIADKLPAWMLKKEGDPQRIFNESLERLGTDYFDFYLLHSVEDGHYQTYEKFGCFDFLKKMKEEDRIRHIGFSFHGDAKLLDEILTEHPELEFVQLQLNYLDWDNGVIQSRLNYETARKYNKPVIVMEPVKGGTLADFPQDIKAVYQKLEPNRSMASWALRFLLDKPGIMTILSGMNGMDQMKDNIHTVKSFSGWSEQEDEAVKKVVSSLLSVKTIPCTKCRYCTPGCPMHIDIPELFTAFNAQKMYGENRRYTTYYKNHTKNGHNPASDCIACGQCQRVCPQHLPIIQYLKEVSAEFE